MILRTLAVAGLLLTASAAGAATLSTSGSAAPTGHASSHLPDNNSSIFDRWGNLLTRTDCTRAGGSWNTGKRTCGPKTR